MNVLDDELIQRMCSQLDVLAAGVSPIAPDLDVHPVVSVGGRRPSPRRRLVVVAAASLALVVGAAGLLMTRGDGSAVGDEHSTPETLAPVVTRATEPQVAHPTSPSPAGWDLLDWGNVRISLPPDLSPFRPGNGCQAVANEQARSITCGDQWVRIVPAELTAVPDEVVNGLHVVLRTDECDRCQTIDIYELAVSVTVRWTTDSPLKVTDTIGPSGTWRYQNEPRSGARLDWQEVSFHGASIRVPQGWFVETVGPTEPSPCPGDLGANVVLLDDGLPTDCDQPLLRAPRDGARLHRVDLPLAVHPGWAEQQIVSGSGTKDLLALTVGYGSD
ncbi:MAG TPA: hypothetical protein VH761_01910, partial [Ilumatobacteraceae bacterium]